MPLVPPRAKPKYYCLPVKTAKQLSQKKQGIRCEKCGAYKPEAGFPALKLHVTGVPRCISCVNRVDAQGVVVEECPRCRCPMKYPADFYIPVCRDCANVLVRDPEHARQERLRIDRTPVTPLCTPTDLLAQDIGYKNYTEYLASAHWKEFKKRVKKKNCFCCEGTTNLHLHHTTYKRIGNELPTDVVTVCDSCHNKIHGEAAYTSLTYAHLVIKERFRR